MPHRLSLRAGGRRAGLGSPAASYQTARVACIARRSRAGEAWQLTAFGRAALLPRVGSSAGGVQPFLNRYVGRAFASLVRPARIANRRLRQWFVLERRAY